MTTTNNIMSSLLVLCAALAVPSGAYGNQIDMSPNSAQAQCDGNKKSIAADPQCDGDKKNDKKSIVADPQCDDDKKKPKS